MLIDVVRDHAEEALLSRLESGGSESGMRAALHFRCSQMHPPPSEEEALEVLKDPLSDYRAAMYLLRDGDIVVTWSGAQQSLLDRLCTSFYRRFLLPENAALHHYYDMQAHGEDLRLMCKRRLAGPGEDLLEAVPAYELTERQAEYFRIAKAARKNRPKMEILVVEDQTFSAKLLQGLLLKKFKTHVAYSAEEALDLYFANAPDIVLLDIELPGMSGHRFAETVNRLDDRSYVVMISANNSMEDVMRAKGNNVKGFVVKPYSKQKVMGAIDKFMEFRRKK